MAIYEYQGQQYDIETDDPAVAKAKILSHLGQGAEQPAPSPSPAAAPIMAPRVEVSTKEQNPFLPRQSEEFNPSALLAVGDVIASTPGFITQTIASLGNVVAQGVMTGKVDTKVARQFGQSVAQKMSLLPEAGEKMPGEYLAGKLGAGEAYKRSLPNRVLGKIDETIEFTADELAKAGVMDKDANRILIDSALVFAPLLRRTKSTPIKGLTDEGTLTARTDRPVDTASSFNIGDSVNWTDASGVPQVSKILDIKERNGTKLVRVSSEDSKYGGKGVFVPFEELSKIETPPSRRVTEQGVEVPVPTVDPKSFNDSLYNLDNLYKQDLTEAINFDKVTKDMGLDIGTKEKFRRFDEGQAKGNELIDNQISDLQKRINLLQADNARLFKENDYRSTVNPEGTVADFRRLPEEVKATIKSNYDTVKSLREEVDTLVNKRSSTEKLLPYEASVYSRMYVPMRSEIRNLTKELIDRGLAEPRKLTEDFASRRIMPKDKTTWEKTKEAIVGRDYTEQETGNTFVSDAANTRGYYVLENPNTKKRTTISLGEETERGTIPITEFRNKKPINNYEVPKELFDNPDAKILGRNLREATIDEINLNIGQQYSRNYNAVMGQRIAELRDQLRKDDWVNELVNSPNFKQIGVKLSDYPQWKKLPEGFRTLKYTDKMPRLRDYAFENRIAEILDDYNKPASTNPIVRATNSLVTNMMLVPIAHMHNELAHWGITRGVSGFINPVRLGRMLKDFPEAYSQVINRGEIYQQILKEGGSLMSANVRNSTYLENAFKESADVLKKTPQFKEMASRLGRTPADLYEGMSKFSNTSMWTVRDVLYTQLIMEKMRREGISMKQAIDSVERHMPNYRLPSRIGEKVLGGKLSRMASQSLGNRNVFLFARYHHGMVNSALNTVKDMGMLGKETLKSKQFKEGVDSALAVVAAMAVVYPMLDQMSEFVAQVMDSDGKVAEAKTRRAGVLHVFDTIKEVAEGKKDAYALSSILVTMNPVIQTMIELAFNYELYNRREIVNPLSPAGTIMMDYANYLSRKVPQVGQAMRATDEDYGTGLAGVLLRNFFDIRTKTADQIDREERQVERKQTEAENRELEM
jgi:hypothetical protein